VALHSRAYYAKNITARADTVTVHAFGVSSYLETYFTEYAGIDAVSPIDIQAGNSGSAGSVTSGNGETSVSGILSTGGAPQMRPVL